MSRARDLIEMTVGGVSPVAPIMSVGARPRKQPMQNFHQTLGQAINAGIQYLQSQGAEFNEAELREPFTYDGVQYNADKKSDAAISSLNGKPTKKWAHLQVWRDETGRYEVNAYIL